MSQFHLLKTRKFWPLFWTQFLGAFNDNFLKNAMVILITFKAVAVFGIPASQMVALAGGVFILPFFLFSATAGQLADKMEKSRLVRWIKLAEIGIMLLAAIGFLSEHFEFLLLVLFLMGLHSTFFGPIKYSILPQHLSEAELVEGNALVEAGTFLAILLGTIAGGVLVSTPNGAGVVSVGLTVVAIIGWLTSRSIPVAPAVAPELEVEWNVARPTLEIYRFTKKNRTVFLSILGISWFWFFGAAVLSLFPPYCKEVLHANQGVVTLFLATFSIGIGLGSMLCSRLSRGHLELGLVPLGSLGISIFVTDLYFVGTPAWALQAEAASVGVMSLLGNGSGWRILFDLLMLSVFSGFFIVPLYTLMQERSEVSHRSRIIAGNNTLNALFMVLSSILILVLLRLNLTIPELFLVLGGLNILVAIYIYTVLPEFMLRLVVWFLANVLYRLRIEGSDQIPKQGAAVLVCNHMSFVDWMVIAAGVRRPVRFIMDHSFAKGPVTRFVLKQAKVILIASAKENPGLLRSAFEKAAEELSAGNVVCIFPEGTITRHGRLNPFKPGVEKMVRDTPVPVIPMALCGLWGSIFSREGGRAIVKRPTRFWSRVKLKIGTPVAAEQVTAELLQQRVAELWDET